MLFSSLSTMEHLLIQWHAMVLLMLIWPLPSRGHYSSTDDELLYNNTVCGGLGSCGGDRRTDNLREVNCQCGPACWRLGTCCFDSPYRRYQGGLADCFWPPDPNTDPVYMLNSCHPNWQDDSVRELCNGDPKDFLLKVPVTHPKDGITYRNFFCYVCNFLNVDVDPPEFWNIKLESPLYNVERSQLTDLEYDEATQSWNIEGQWVGVFETVSEQIYGHVQRCSHGNVISTCDPTWTDEVTQQLCHSYTAVVKVMNKSSFRNPHCAICNFVNLSELVCNAWPMFGRRYPYGFMFTGIFSMEDKVKRCHRNAVYDRFSNKCRRFKCGRGQRIVDGECV